MKYMSFIDFRSFLRLRLLMLLTLFCVQSPSSTVFAQKQKQDALYIYRNDGGFNGFFFAEIDRFAYSKIDTLGVEHDDYVVQEVYTVDTLYRIPISAIDSIGFVTPETVYKKDVAHTTESDLWNYVIGSDSIKMLLLAANTPQAMIPKAGDKIVTTLSRPYLPGGFYGKVLSVQNGTQGITVNCEVPPFTELFDQWVCKAAASTVTDKSRRIARRSENAIDMEIPLEGTNVDIDLTNLQNFPLAISENWSLKGKGRLAFGINHSLRVRLFAAVRLLLGFNYDCTTRYETTSYLNFNVAGEVSGQVDFKLFDKQGRKVKVWIPHTPFTVEVVGGLSASVGGKVEFDLQRSYTTSVYEMFQYNNSFYDEERTQYVKSFHTVANKSVSSLTGEASISAGPYIGVYACLIDKEISKVGFRFDIGMKATLSAELKFTDYLLAAIPNLLPAYMLLNPTPLYDYLNRDGSVTYGPFFKCDFEAELAHNKSLKYAETLFDEGKLAEITGFDMGLKFEGGLVPKFQNTKLTFDDEMVPTASVDISRPALLYPPVGFAAYYTKSGKQLGKTLWQTECYESDRLKHYQMELKKFGGGKEVRVYPVVKLLRLYELLASPYASYTVPAEMKIEPELIEMDGAAGEGRCTVTDNLDRVEDNYERTVTINFGEDVKPWFTGTWEGNDYVIKVTQNDSIEPRSADITFTVFNKDESIRLEKKAMVVQGPSKEGEASVDPLLVEFPAEGGVAFVTYDYGDFEYVSAGFHPYPTVGGVKANWSADYQGTNRYPRQMYITAPPNTTDKETIDTLGFYFTNDKSIPNKDRYNRQVVIKRAPGPFSLPSLSKLFAGSWLSPESGATWQRRFVFNHDGTYTEYNRFRDSANKEWKKWNEKQGTYYIKGWETGARYFRVLVSMSTEGDDEFIELYPHFMRSGGFYFDPE